MLSVVSTPIGNLGDITARAKEVLAQCDAIICEDTRVTGQLLHLLGLPKKELISFHSYSDTHKLDLILQRLRKGDHLALVSDAGTPGISDPGYAVVAATLTLPSPSEEGEGVRIEVVPGPSAFLAALSVSGLPVNQFVYLGFLPLKKGRKTLLESFRREERTVVFYESVHRIERTLLELVEVLSDQEDRPIVICRELTKMHEEVLRTTIGGLREVLPVLTVKGEFVVIVSGAP